METNHILNADVLDIIFDGRNKNYGAYQLRKNYNRRLIMALAVILGVCLLAVAGSVFGRNDNSKHSGTIEVKDVTLVAVDKPVVSPPVPPPPPPRDLLRIKVINNTPPIIVDEPVPPLPTVDDMDKAALSNYSQDGKDGSDYIAPPVEKVGPGTVKEIKEDVIDDKLPIQIQASFPGGIAAWIKYLERNLKQNIPIDNGAPAGDYQVVVSFVVDKDGTVSQVKAENDPGYGIAAEAVRVIVKSGKWLPAIQNGNHVVYRQTQPVTFRVQEE